MHSLRTPEEKAALLGTWTREKGLSGNALKALACFFMFFDHLAQGVALRSLGFSYLGISEMASMPIPARLAGISVLFGRIAFPIFCFFLVQGILLTRDANKQIMRLLIFGLISEIPFDLGLFGEIFYWDHQNVMFTLATGAAVVSLIEKIRKREVSEYKKWIGIGLVVLAGGFLAEGLRFDYGFNGVFAIALLYAASSDRIKSLFMGLIAFLFEAPFYGTVYLALPLLYTYNGRRGRGNRYGFYLFYPGHLLFLYLLSFYV